MKCGKCGAEIDDDSLFCKMCGEKIKPQKKFCTQCGKELSSDGRFCHFCGASVISEQAKQDNTERNPENREENRTENGLEGEIKKGETPYVSAFDIIEKERRNDENRNSMHRNPENGNPMHRNAISRKPENRNPENRNPVNRNPENRLEGEDDKEKEKTENLSFFGKLKKGIAQKWQKMDNMRRVISILMILVILLLIIGLIIGKKSVIIISVIQIIGLIVTSLMHKGVIAIEETNVKFLVLAVSALLTVVNIWSFSWGKSKESEVPEKAVEVAIPLNASECLDSKYPDVVEQFEKAGFTNIKLTALDDLHSGDRSTYQKIIQITVDSDGGFERGVEVKSDKEIEIVYHDYIKHKAKLNIDFSGNIIKNKYNVKVLVNGNCISELPHGEDAEITFDANDGENRIEFVSTKNDSVTGAAVLLVLEDTEASYAIECEKDQIIVTPR